LSGRNTAEKFSTENGAGSGLLSNWSAGRRNADTIIQ
jgi:hypothetical protein